jgi:hypothetical protein
MRAAFFLLLTGVMAVRNRNPIFERTPDAQADLTLLPRQNQSPSRSFDSDFPSKTTVPSVPKCAEECYAKARNQTVRCWISCPWHLGDQWDRGEH